MKHFIIIFLAVLTFTSCDCIQKATGVVLDRQTLKPIQNVSLGKYEEEDTANSYSKRIYTNDNGQFAYHSTSGGFRNCPDLVLYFNKQGYQKTKMSFPSFSQNDTVLLYKITLQDFSKLDSIDKTNNESLIASENNITKAFVYLKNGDSSIYLTSNIRQEHRIFGYKKPDTKSERLLLLSVFTNDVENNPFGCKLGAYYDTGDMKDLKLKYLRTIGTFVEAAAFDNNNNKTTNIYFEKKWIEIE